MKTFRFILILSALIPTSVVMSSVIVRKQINGETKLIISSIENELTHELAKNVLRAAYNKINIKVEFNDLPARRALEWANAGKTDGDIARIDGTEQEFTNLIKISTPVTEFKGVVFTIKIDKTIRSWEDLRGLSVGIVGGIRYSEIGTKGLDRIVARDNIHLFKLLSMNRIDVAIAGLDAGVIEIHRNFSKTDIHVIGEPLHASPLFHFINRKHKAIVPEIELILKKMMQSGEIESIRNKKLKEALSE